MKRFITWLLIVCLAPFLTGCEDLADKSLTGKVWNNLAANHDGPAPDPNLKIFQAPDRKDFLVQYDEARDRNATIKRRAYWLYASERRVEKGKKPHFVNPHKADRLQAVKVETNSVPDAIVDSALPTGAVLLFDHRHFTLVSNGSDLGTFYLPAYGDGASRAQLVVLTPVAVVGDTVIVLVIVGAVAGVIYLVALCDSNAQY
jgi:hypothetical protein